MAASDQLRETLWSAVRQVAGGQRSAVEAFDWRPLLGEKKSGGTGVAVAKVIGNVFASGFGIRTAISAIAGLFGDDDEPPAPVKYQFPEALRLEMANPKTPDLEFQPVSYGQGGVPRAAAPRPTPAGGGTPAAPQVTINVQAMDSRSFQDHSDEIARAVRQAMLNMHAINDVVGDL